MSRWYEVWLDDSLDPPYLLLVEGRGDHVRILDPKEQNRVVYTASNYQDAKVWLLEDEYVQVRGRVEVEDG
jgi:hypothetical protein